MNDRGKKILKWVLDKGLREGWLYKQDREDIMEYWKAGTKCSCKGCETKEKLDLALEDAVNLRFLLDRMRCKLRAHGIDPSCECEYCERECYTKQEPDKNGQEVGASAGRGEVGGSGDSVIEGGCACSPTKGVGC